MGEPDVKSLLRNVLAELVGADGNLGDMEDSLPALTAFASEFAAPDFACVMAGIPPTPPQTYPGVEGIAEAWNDYGEAFENVRAELEEVRESARHMVLLVRQVAVTRHQGVEIAQPSAMVFAFDGGRVTRLEFHLDRNAALRSAGLDG